MISYREALNRVLSACQPLREERVPLDKLSGRVLAEEIRAPFPLPRFDNSAVDGYAVRVNDFNSASGAHPVAVDSRITVHAGDRSEVDLWEGNAVKVMTGAPIPRGAEAVVMREEIERAEGTYLYRPPLPGENIRRAGEELAQDALLLNQGTVVTPPVIGILATVGRSDALVYGEPSVAIIVTGDELRSPGEPLQGGQIYDSNGPSLKAAALLHSRRVTASRCRDVEAELAAAISGALAECEVVITVGGVSMGDRDHIRPVCAALGIEELFWRIAIKPGKPVYFGRLKDGEHGRWVFGLPGNPVSALVTFELLVKPALWRLKGHPDPSPKFLRAVLGQSLRKKSDRTEFVRGVYRQSDDGVLSAIAVKGQDSHMLSGLGASDCLIIFPAEADYIPTGAPVELLPLAWSRL